MSKMSLRFFALALFFLGLALSGSFPTGAMIAGDLSWDYIGGVVNGLSIGIMWIATTPKAKTTLDKRLG